MLVYIDNEYKCHAKQETGMNLVETSFFDGKCDAYIEGYRFIPAGESWTNEKGTVFAGESVFPWKPYADLDAAQREYEREQLADMRAALELLGVSV